MPTHSLIQRFYPESSLLGHTFVDGTVAFYNSINNLISPNLYRTVLLDLGCGRGCFVDDINSKENAYVQNLRNFKGRVKKVIGVDIDPNASTNPALDEFHLIEINKSWPVADASIDICISDWVIEHVQDIPFFFAELNRVIKKNGFVCFRTTNKFGYIALFSMMIRNKSHSKLLKKIQAFRKEEDVFPTVYKCNTRRKFVQTLNENGFESFVYYHVSEPSYLTFSYLSFAFGYYIHKILPAVFKTTILAFGRKK